MTIYPATRQGRSDPRWVAILPIELHVDGRITLTNVLLDTGATRSSIPSSLAEKLVGRGWDTFEPAGDSFGFGGRAEVRSIPGSLVLEGRTFQSPIRVFESTGKIPPHIGLDFLEQFDVLLRLHEPEPVFVVTPAVASPYDPDELRIVVTPDPPAALPVPNRSERRSRRRKR